MAGETIIIIGAGFSGTMLAINLLRQPDNRIILIEKAPDKVARGTAYGTNRPEHLLNVRASNMSAYPDDADHFVRWLEQNAPPARSHTASNHFVARETYGRYLGELLKEAAHAAGENRFNLIVGEAVSATPRLCSGFDVRLADGSALSCDILVLAQGNLPPGENRLFDDLPPALYHANPWSGDWLRTAKQEDHILLLGTGLTSVDVIVSLEKAGFTGQVTALSRRGLMPQAHLESGPVVGKVDRPNVNGSWLVRRVRQRAGQVGWHVAVDELRPHMQDLWRRLDHQEQKRFLRHLRPYWDIHRHRIAPDVAAVLRKWRDEKRLSFAAGKIVAASVADARITVTWRIRGSDETRSITANRIINCTGPHGDIGKSIDPLLRQLNGSGFIRSDAHHLGLDVDRFGRVFASDGSTRDDLRAVGPLTKGEAWEIIAVPDIRRQLWDLARSLTNSHWVGGEGL